ncbi:MAG: preprotein translocase subunit SecA [Bacillota bacterium]
MLGVLKNLLDDNAKEIKRMTRRIQEINALEPAMQALGDGDLHSKTAEFRQRLENGSTLEELLPEAFATVREVSRRVLGLRHFDVQLMGGIVLHQGRIAEMKTGEGKTLVATLPVYLNALEGKGVHVVTVNDYLARRDSQWMGQIYRFLGLSVGLIVHGLDSTERHESYRADVTYGTNNEFGFDYLRDNMAIHVNHLVQRDLHYAIVDEVDSILIDEARTPLIISGQADKPTELYFAVAKMVPRLRREQDYTVDEKAHTVALTEEGVARMEQMLGVENLYDDSNMEISHHVNQALKAHALMKRDRDYVVKDGEVIIVDEFTGRMMFGRRYSDGLHQAIEAKEGVKIERESQTLATITFQNYFRMYKKLAGMTGTAATEEEEFRKIYGLDVVVMPTNMPMIRRDHPDVIYRSEKGKFNAVVEEIVERHQQGQPLLVGTISIEKSEQLSSLLKKRGITHQVLNAKYHEQEATIVAQAGQPGMVTIATNMAGRGTDILLGGNPEFMAQAEYQKDGYNLGEGDPELFRKIAAEMKNKTMAAHQQVVNSGGLHIIGTERHESRRIDNQLRGRSGRQGDPGSSRFYVSLEDDLMRLFGSDSIAGLMDRIGMDDNTPVDHPLISRAIETAQKRVEARNFDARKHVLEYDDVMNQQREVIYNQRRQVLEGYNLKENLEEMIRTIIDNAIAEHAGGSNFPEEWDLKGLLEYAGQVFLPTNSLTADDLRKMDKEEVRQALNDHALDFYHQREGELGEETLRELERVIMLRVVDEKWMDHLDAMDQLRQGIGLRAYGQRDPLVEYKFESYQMFNNMIAAIQEDTVKYVYRVNVVERPQQHRNVVENKYAEDQAKQPVRKENRIGRNDPCPCGSGRKYKKCCGKSA